MPASGTNGDVHGTGHSTEPLIQRYARSVEQLARAEAVIPLGSQTFSKSRTQLPVGAAPLFAQRAKGSRLWDVDGNEYLDLVSALGAIVLGYGDDEITEAVTRQLHDGVILSLAHPIEAEVAERLVDLIPCAERVRFGKNGTDATSAAIRLARAFTGRDHVIVLGYHGWQDWYIGSTTMHRGVPQPVRELTHSVPFNDLQALVDQIDRLSSGTHGSGACNVAAVIMEPMTSTWPQEGYLQEVRRITEERGIVLVFDEMLTGFRFAPGGAQEYFGVTPDLAAFGKGLSNGFPLSAIVGRADILDVMPTIFFSGTYGGETLSLTAARIVLDRMATGAPTTRMAQLGQRLTDGIEASRPESSRGFLNFSGHPSWVFHQWSIEDPQQLAEAKTLLLQEILRRGVLSLSTHDVTTAFTEAEIDHAASQIAEAITVVTDAMSTDTVRERLECDPILPLFRVRS